MVFDYEIISEFYPLKEDQVGSYTEKVLKDHGIAENIIEEFVSNVKGFRLCHGRARFIAFIIEEFLETENKDLDDIDYAITRFIEGITDKNRSVFPLRYLKESGDGWGKVVGTGVSQRTLGSLVTDAVSNYILKNEAVVNLRDTDAALAIQFGLGFGKITKGVFTSVAIQE